MHDFEAFATRIFGIASTYISHWFKYSNVKTFSSNGVPLKGLHPLKKYIYNLKSQIETKLR